MSGKIRNPERRCKICGNKCEKQMRYCKLCAREVKEIRARRKGIYFTPKAALDVVRGQAADIVTMNPPLVLSTGAFLGEVLPEVKHLSAPRRGAQERKPPRQETGPSPAILEGTR